MQVNSMQTPREDHVTRLELGETMNSSQQTVENKRVRRRRKTHLAALVTLTLFSIEPAWAADVRFWPAIEARAIRVGNVENIGVGVTDTALRTTLELGWSKSTPRFAWELKYAPFHEKYVDDSDLDYTGHALESILRKRFTPRSSVHFGVAASRSSSWQAYFAQPNLPISAVPRTTIDAGALQFGGENRVTPRNTLSWDIAGSGVRYGDQEMDSMFIFLVDHTKAGAEGGWRFQTATGVTWGAALQSEIIDYDEFETASVQSLRATTGRPLGPSAQLELAVGAAWFEQGSNSSTEADFDLSFEWRRGVLSVMSLGVTQSIGPGSGLGGPTLDRGMYGGWSRLPAERGIAAQVLAGYTTRDPLSPDLQVQDEPDYFFVLSSLDWRFGRYLVLGVFHRYQNQALDGVAALEAANSSGGVMVRVERRRPPRPTYTGTAAGRALKSRVERDAALPAGDYEGNDE